MSAPLYVGLVHYPIQNKQGEVVVTSVTNLDIHDISRSCRTFGVQKYFLITPLEAQHGVVGRILNHWSQDQASLYNPDRQDALSLATLANSVEAVEAELLAKHGVAPVTVVTGANFGQEGWDTNTMAERMLIDERPYLLLFGTGWGLHSEVVKRAHACLLPIRYAPSEYNHLSVRSAVAIYLDRLRSR